MDADNSTNIENAGTVNTGSDLSAHPAVIYLVAFVTVGVLIGFGWVTYAILSAPTAVDGKNVVNGIDPATKGAVIQTWNNLAVAAAAVWTTSSIVNRLKGGR
jgi:hypothetical protein